MKKFIFLLTVIGGIAALASCTTVKEQPATHTSTTTTESTSMQQPAPVTSETQTVRSY
jgi:hypothetical protein